MRFRFCASLVLAAAATPVWAALTADEILDKARAALGAGGAPLTSLTLTGTRRVPIQTPDGPSTMTRESELHFLLPGRFLRSETHEMPGGMPGPTILEGLDGETSWRSQQNAPSGGNMVMVIRGPGGADENTPEATRARTRALRTHYLRNLLLFTLTAPSDAGVKFEYFGEAESPEGRAWIVDATAPDNFAMRLFIDQKTNLPLMASWRGLQSGPMIRTMRMAGPPPGGRDARNLPPPAEGEAKPKEVEYEARLSAFEKHGGRMVPTLVALSAEGKPVEEFELKSVKINPILKPEKFRR